VSAPPPVCPVKFGEPRNRLNDEYAGQPPSADLTTTAMSGVWVLNPTDFDGPIPEVSSHASEKLTKGCNGASVNAPSPLSGSFGRRSLTSIRRPVAPQHLFQRTCS